MLLYAQASSPVSHKPVFYNDPVLRALLQYQQTDHIDFFRNLPFFHEWLSAGMLLPQRLVQETECRLHLPMSTVDISVAASCHLMLEDKVAPCAIHTGVLPQSSLAELHRAAGLQTLVEMEVATC